MVCARLSVFLGRDARPVGFFATTHGGMLWSIRYLSIFEYSNYSWITRSSKTIRPRRYLHLRSSMTRVPPSSGAPTHEESHALTVRSLASQSICVTFGGPLANAANVRTLTIPHTNKVHHEACVQHNGKDGNDHCKRRGLSIFVICAVAKETHATE